MTELCEDCPDHEACMTGWNCETVKRVDIENRMTQEERFLAHKLSEAGISEPQAVTWVFRVVRDAMIRGGQEAVADLLHPEFGSIWRPPMPDGKGGTDGGGEAWKAYREGAAEGWKEGHRIGWQSGFAGEPYSQRLDKNRFEEEEE